MPDPTPPPSTPTEPTPPARPNITIEAGRDVSVGTFVGGDMVSNTTTHVNTTNSTTQVGFSAKQVQTLLITVGLLVFFTAACFFSGGVALGGVAIVALNQQTFTSSPAAAIEMQTKLNALQSLSPGQAFVLPITEDQISSYVKFILGSQIGFAPETGKVRFLDINGNAGLVVAGEMESLGNLLVAATFEIQNVPGQPLKITGAGLQVFDGGDSGFGWVTIPVSLLEPVAKELNGLFGSVQIVTVRDVTSDPNLKQWEVEGAVR